MDALYPFTFLDPGAGPLTQDSSTFVNGMSLDYNGYFQYYGWPFDSTGNPVLFRTFGPTNQYFAEVETFFPRQGISKDKSTFPQFRYCSLDVSLDGGKVLHVGGYVKKPKSYLLVTTMTLASDPIIVPK